MKKRLTTLLALALVLMMALAACTSPSPSGDESPSPSPSEETTSPTPSEADESPSPSEEEEPSPSEEDLPSEEPAAPGNNLEGLQKQLQDILDTAELGDEMMTELGTVTADNSQMCTGLTAEQLSQYVKEAAYSRALISASAHNIALIDCVDEEAAAEVKALVAAGFDPAQWVCVFPDTCFVQESATTVLLVCSTQEIADKMKAAFPTVMGGNAGTPEEFFNKSTLG